MKPQIYRHGELLLKPETLPEGSVLSETSKKYIVGDGNGYGYGYGDGYGKGY